MNIEAGKYYKTRDGLKAYVGYEIEEDVLFRLQGHIYDENGVFLSVASWLDNGKKEIHAIKTKRDLVALWEDKKDFFKRPYNRDDVEEIDVSAMNIAIYRFKEDGREWIETSHILNVNNDVPSTDSLVAKVTVKDWQDIQQGKRKLIIGEGL